MKTKTGKRIFLALGCVLLAVLAWGAWYINDYYRADQPALSDFSSQFELSPTTLSETITVYAPEKSTAGLIFYPGGKVEPHAYEPLLLSCAR